LVPADWQAGVNNAASGGQIIGLLINGWAQTKYGYRTVYMIGMVAMASCIFVLFFAVNIEMILVGNLLAGIPWGIFQVITTAYASEVVPPALRGVSRPCMLSLPIVLDNFRLDVLGNRFVLGRRYSSRHFESTWGCRLESPLRSSMDLAYSLVHHRMDGS
jgi:hypothetical protein